MRHEDPLGDYGRQIRQRQVLQAVLKKGLAISSAPRYSEILKSMSKNLKTDLTFNDMMTVGFNYRDATKHVVENALQCDNATVDGISYQVAPDHELLRVSNYVRSSLNLPTADKLTEQQRAINSNEEASAGDSLFTNGESVTKNQELVK
ncbi:hypothetical protein [Fructilactobacillus florum]